MRAELISFRNWARFDSWFVHQGVLCEKQKIVHYFINNDRIVTQILWWALLTMIQNISYKF
jgi:hypothetical protein